MILYLREEVLFCEGYQLLGFCLEADKYGDAEVSLRSKNFTAAGQKLKVSIMVWKFLAFLSHMQNLIFQILLFSLYPRQNPGKNVSEWFK